MNPGISARVHSISIFDSRPKREQSLAPNTAFDIQALNLRVFFGCDMRKVIS